MGDAEITRFVDKLVQEIAANTDTGVERRKLRTVLSEIGLRRRSQASLERLREALESKGIYSQPLVSSSMVRPDEWVRFSSKPLPTPELLFPTEKQMKKAIMAAIERVPPLDRLCSPESEFRVAGQRIDIFCRDKQTNAAVAIELKKDWKPELAHQMIRYLRLLDEHGYGEEAPVRGIIITGSHDPLTASLIDGNSRYQIDWYVYDIALREPRITDAPTR